MAEKQVRFGIFTNAKQAEFGKWSGDVDTSRICNHGEKSQCDNYSVHGSGNGLVYADRGDECKLMIRKTRECVTTNQFLLFDGVWWSCCLQGLTTHSQ